MKEASNQECFFCGSTEVALPNVGIAMGMAGDDYSFCADCLKGITADDFWRRFFNEHDWTYPPDAAMIVADTSEN